MQKKDCFMILENMDVAAKYNYYFPHNNVDSVLTWMEMFVLYGIRAQPIMDTEHDFEVYEYLVEYYLIDVTSI